jgi:receptor expression-enhancing protein 1/2/3/4
VEGDVERWCQYWSVVGAFVGAEYLVGWMFSWLPFYDELKTLFLLFLSLPQIQGSTFIYISFIQPFFAKNEKEIEAGIVSLQNNVLSFVQTRLYALWELLWSVLSKTPAAGRPPNQGNVNAQQSPAPGISLDATIGLLKTYGPSLLNSLKSTGASNDHPATPLTPTASSSSINTISTQARTPQTEAPPFPEPVHM